MAAIRFRVVELFSDDPLLEGHVDYLEDTESAAAPQSIKQLVELYETCHTLLFSGIPKEFDAAPPDQLAYTIASALPLDLLWKQQLLELRTESNASSGFRRTFATGRRIYRK